MLQLIRTGTFFCSKLDKLSPCIGEIDHPKKDENTSPLEKDRLYFDILRDLFRVSVLGG